MKFSKKFFFLFAFILFLLIGFASADWTKAGDLQIRDNLFLANGEKAVITNIQEVEKKVDVFNLKVSDNFENYFANNVLVHNGKRSSFLSQDWENFRKNPKPFPAGDAWVGNKAGDIPIDYYTELTPKNTNPNARIFRGTSIQRVNKNGGLTYSGINKNYQYSKTSRSAHFSPYASLAGTHAGKWGAKNGMIMEVSMGDLFELQKRGVIGKIYTTLPQHPYPPEVLVEVFEGTDVDGIFRYWKASKKNVCDALESRLVD